MVHLLGQLVASARHDFRRHRRCRGAKIGTKSQIVKSTSCPTADMTGTRELNTARATTSSLNAHKSSSEPPPRPTINTSTSCRVFMYWIAGRSPRRPLLPELLPGIPGRDAVVAPLEHAQDILDCGTRGRCDHADLLRQGRQRSFARRVEKPLTLQRALSCSKATWRAPTPAGSMCSTTNWKSPRGG